MSHRHCHVFFDRASADAETGGDLAVSEAFDLVHDEDPARTRRKLGDRLGEASLGVLRDELLFGILCRVRDLGAGLDRAVTLFAPLAITGFATPALAKVIEVEVVRHAKEVAAAVHSRTGV